MQVLSVFQSPRIWFSLLLCSSLFVPWGLILAQGTCEIAEEHYEEGNYDQAITAAQAVLTDPATGIRHRMCAYKVLRKSCCAKMDLCVDWTKEYLRQIVDEFRQMDPHYRPGISVKCPPPCPDLPSRLDSEFGSTLAILPLHVHCPSGDTGQSGSLGVSLRDQLEASLRPVPGLRLVERQRIIELYEEIARGEKGRLDPATAAKAGRILGAQSVSFGSFTCLPGDQTSISARIVRTETGEILVAEVVDGDADDYLNLMQELGQRITEAVQEGAL